MRKMGVLFAGIGLAAVMTAGCGAKTQQAAVTEAEKAAQEKSAETTTASENSLPETNAPETEEDEEENYDTGDASLDNVRNQDGVGEREYLYIRDPEKIEELKNIWVYDELCYYDPFFRAEDAEVSLMILDLEKEDDREYDYEEYEDGSWNTRVRVVFPEGRIPDFVWESEEE